MKDIYSPFGNRKQASVHDAENPYEHHKMSAPFRLGIVSDVFTSDSPFNLPGISGGAQGYITYNVKLTPEGVVVKNIPAMMTGGHMPNGMSIDPSFPPNVNVNGPQNTEETPLLIGQPVIVGFFNNSPLNGFIVGPISCQYNAGSQSAAEYPKKSQSWQGTTWWTDKNGNKEVDFPSTGTYIIKMGGQVLVELKNGEIDLGAASGDSSLQPTILGNALNAYLTNFITSIFNVHTHASPIAPPVPLGTPPSGIKTTIVKVK